MSDENETSVETPRALAGVRVIEIGCGVPTAFAARLLADHGADVVKIENLQCGRGHRDENGDSALFEFLNWNKRSFVPALDDSWLSGADILLIGRQCATDQLPQVDGEAALAAHPHLVAVTVSDFGSVGPYADYHATDLVVQAMSGMMTISGSSAREPLKHGLNTAAYGAGLNAAYAAVAGLLAAENTGVGVAIDVAVRDCLTSELVMNNAYFAFNGAVQGRAPRTGDPLDGHPISGPWGHLSLQTSARQSITRIADFFADRRFLDPRFDTPEGRVAHSEELAALIEEHLEAESARDVFLRGSGDGLIIGFAQGAGELLNCPQLNARDVFVEFAARNDSCLRWKLPARLANLSLTPTQVTSRAPRLGEHTEQIRAELKNCGEPKTAVQANVPLRGPLAGVTVLDLSVIFAVPYMAALLADLGAEVIKVEAPARLDQTRTDWGSYFDNDPGSDPWNRSATFQVVNRGKKSVVLDLSTEAGRAVLRRMIAGADIVLDNFTPRVLRGWGMTYESLASEHPELIMLSNTGYGSTGPWSGFKAQGTTLEATMGLMAVTGYAGGGPARAGQSAPDFYACWAGLLAICAALRHRRRTGRGQWIDLGMYQLGASLIPEALIHHQATGQDLPRVGVADLGAVLSDVFLTQDQRWLAVSAPERHHVDALAKTVGPVGDQTLSDAVRDWAAGTSVDDAVRTLQTAGVPAGLVHDARDLSADPQLRERGFYETVVVPTVGEPRSIIGRPYTWTSTATEARIAGPAPCFGADNRSVLREHAGLDDAEISALYEANIVTDSPLHAPVGRPMDFDLLIAKQTFTYVETRCSR